ncbi:MAG: hypothetical protein HY059_05000 [Proteobacteria bacterium]|nr:hypothetical protein [Pseudomonadota bacterium]
MALLPLMLAAALAAPPFPFQDWARIREDAHSVMGGFAPCDAETSSKVIGDYVIEREDGTWRLFGARYAEESDRWVGASLDGDTLAPRWVYQGGTRGNEILLERVDAYDPAIHGNACPLIFRAPLSSGD